MKPDAAGVHAALPWGAPRLPTVAVHEAPTHEPLDRTAAQGPQLARERRRTSQPCPRAGGQLRRRDGDEYVVLPARRGAGGVGGARYGDVSKRPAAGRRMPAACDADEGVQGLHWPRPAVQRSQHTSCRPAPRVRPTCRTERVRLIWGLKHGIVRPVADSGEHAVLGASRIAKTLAAEPLLGVIPCSKPCPLVSFSSVNPGALLRYRSAWRRATKRRSGRAKSSRARY